MTTIYLTHHSHCDLGYTHDLPIVYELQRRYIDQALDLIERHGDESDPVGFRWTCEVTSVVEHWLRTASPRQIERFVTAAQRGQIEVCALWCNLTPLATLGQMTGMLQPMHRLRAELGLSIKAAMNSDVNGFSWALTDLLRAAGIEGLTMSINEHFGGAPQPFPDLFRWETPSGDTLPVWSGPTYAHTAWLGFCGDIDQAFQKISAWVTHRHLSGWKAPWIAMQITHPGPQNDNMGPISTLTPWLREFNKRHGEKIRLVLTTPSRFFSAIQSDIPESKIRRGEWNDWWAFGEASTPYETSLFRRASAKLEEADLLSLLGRASNFADLRPRAQDALGHYIEHTWGADCSINHPFSEDSRIQRRHKERFAYDAFSLTRLLRRDGLSHLARLIPTNELPETLVFNPSTEARRETLRLPRRFLEATNLPPAVDGWPQDGAWQHFPDRELFGGDLVDEIGPVELPPLSWTVVTPRDRAIPCDQLVHRGQSISNGRITLAWHEGTFGLEAITTPSRSWVHGEHFGSVVAEEVEGERHTIMRFDDSTTPTTTRRPVWNPHPPLHRSLPTKVKTEVRRSHRSLELIQRARLPHTRAVVARWTLSADHDDVLLEISLDLLPETQAHSYYLILPFDLAEPRRRLASAGLVIDPDRESIPNGCPWWSVQEGIAVGDEGASVYLATLDAPMVGFGNLPLGTSQIAGDSLQSPALAWAWLYNNYWETNFPASASGHVNYAFRLSLQEKPMDEAHLLRTASLLRHSLAYHPLSGNPEGTAPPASLFHLSGGDLLGCTMVGSSLRLIIGTQSTEPEEVTLTEGLVRFAQVEIVAPEVQSLPVSAGTVSFSVEARRPVHLQLTPR